jgi:hypothetical protein
MLPLYMKSTTLKMDKMKLIVNVTYYCRSQWPRGLGHELYLPARMLGLWVQIPHKVWMSAFFIFVMSCVCVCVDGMQLADTPSKES